MVRAILAGQKTQTRRVAAVLAGDGQAPERVIPGHAVRGGPASGNDWVAVYRGGGTGPGGRWKRHSIRCPYGQSGDRLWVRETWALEDCGADGNRVIWQADRAAAWRRTLGDIYYLPSDYNPGRWRPSIHMPRWAFRLTLEVTEVRVQRLQDISEGDALAEGVMDARGWDWLGRLPKAPEGGEDLSARAGFRLLWGSINGKRPGCSWEANPWCWAVSFKVVR